MSSNVITIYGIAGASGAHLAKAFDGWKNLKMTLEQKQIAGRQFEQLFKRLPRHATEPPIVFYRSHADTWTLPGMMLDEAFGGNNRRFKEVSFDTWAVCTSSRIIGKEVPRLRTVCRKLRKSHNIELRWFCTTLIDCHEAMAWLGAGHIFIHFRTAGLSIDDSEKLASLDEVAPWFKERQIRAASPFSTVNKK